MELLLRLLRFFRQTFDKLKIVITYQPLFFLIFRQRNSFFNFANCAPFVISIPSNLAMTVASSFFHRTLQRFVLISFRWKIILDILFILFYPSSTLSWLSFLLFLLKKLILNDSISLTSPYFAASSIILVFDTLNFLLSLLLSLIWKLI